MAGEGRGRVGALAVQRGVGGDSSGEASSKKGTECG